MKFKLDTPTTTHLKFAWFPVTVLDRETGKFYIAWLEHVERKLVSFQGTLIWTHAPYKKSNPYDFGAPRL